MLCILSEINDPYFNLALEEVLLKNRKDEYLILYINDPSVIIGKHQVAHREINTGFVTAYGIPVIRRISGGGTVFHDRGNLNFTFIRQAEPGKQVDFRRHTRPVIDFLQKSGINAKFEGSNDIRVNGFKISGNAEHIHRDRVLHHGTLLFSTSLEKLNSSIRKDKSCYSTRAVGSNPSPVMNLTDATGEFKDICKFRDGMIRYFLSAIENFEVTGISRQTSKDALDLSNARYRQWEWNFAYGPEYTFTNSLSLGSNKLQCELKVKNGIITECLATGNEEASNACGKLSGCRHMPEDIYAQLRKEIPGISREEIYNFF